MIKENIFKGEVKIVNSPSVFDKNFWKSIITMEKDDKVAKFITEQVDFSKERTILFSSSSNITYTNPISSEIRAIIDLETINGQHNLNDHFRSLNNTLPDAGIYIGCAVSNAERKKKVFANYPRLIAKLVWGADFIFNRVMPKFSLTKGVYTFFFRKKHIAISKAEILGRLCYAGFEIIDYATINNISYFSVIKTQEPMTCKNNSYGLIFKMNRISKGGKTVGIYKVRTMHPYSEYLQDYVVKLNGYNENGKPGRDFRLTSWGKIIRKLHLDEIPQLLNLAKGELNIVGVRPLSKFGFESLPPDLQQERIKYKSGCIPPNVSLGLRGFEGVIRAERIYLREMRKNGFLTNLKYFFVAIFNLIQGRHVSA